MKSGRGAPPAAEAPPWVIVGAGYTGARLAKSLLRKGASVVVTRRSFDRAQGLAKRLGGARAAAVDLEEPSSLRGILSEGCVVVDAVPPRQSVAGERALVRESARAGARRLVYLSSTGVYGPGTDEWTTEQDSPAPVTERGRQRLAAEAALLESAREASLSTAVLRIAGIYGPERGVHRRLVGGGYVPRAIGGMVSRIHVDDLIRAIVLVAELESLPFEIINVADDQPAPTLELAREVAGRLGLPLGVPREGGGEEFGANRKIGNQRLKSLGLVLDYPSWKEGLLAAMKEDGSML